MIMRSCFYTLLSSTLRSLKRVFNHLPFLPPQQALIGRRGWVSSEKTVNGSRSPSRLHMKACPVQIFCKPLTLPAVAAGRMQVLSCCSSLKQRLRRAPSHRLPCCWMHLLMHPTARLAWVTAVGRSCKSPFQPPCKPFPPTSLAAWSLASHSALLTTACPSCSCDGEQRKGEETCPVPLLGLHPRWLPKLPLWACQPCEGVENQTQFLFIYLF